MTLHIAPRRQPDQVISRTLLAAGVKIASFSLEAAAPGIAPLVADLLSSTAVQYPLIDISERSRLIFDGAQSYLAAALSITHDWSVSMGAELTRQAREITREAKAFLGDGITQAHEWFLTQADAGAKCVREVREGIRKRLEDPASAVEDVFDFSESCADLMERAARAWAMIKAARAATKRIVDRLRKDATASVDAAGSEAPSDRGLQISMTLNVTVGGPAAGAAIRTERLLNPDLPPVRASEADDTTLEDRRSDVKSRLVKAISAGCAAVREACWTAIHFDLGPRAPESDATP